MGKKRGSKHIAINERDGKDYFNPSQALFRDHCDDFVGRYGLQGGRLVRKERVLDISHAEVLGVSRIRYSPIVIIAVGPGNQPRIPPPTSRASPRERQPCPGKPVTPCTSESSPTRLSNTESRPADAPTSSSSAAASPRPSFAHLALRRGVGTLWHMMRGPLRIKPFDVDLKWMGRFQNVEQSRFWRADSEAERLALLRTARGGAGASRRSTVEFGRGSRLWEDRGCLSAPGWWARALLTRDEARRVRGRSGRAPRWRGCHRWIYIYFATGVETNFATLPYLQTLLKSHPISGCGGVPLSER